MSKGAKWWRAELRRMKSKLMSQCRVCGSSKDVVIYDPRPLWAYPIRTTVCPDHCPDHDFNRHKDGTYCDQCGVEPDQEWWIDLAAYMDDLEFPS